MKQNPMIMILALVLCVTLSLDAVCQVEKESEKIDPKASKIFDKMSEKMKELNAFSFEISLSYDELFNGANNNTSIVQKITASRPNSILIDMKEGSTQVNVVSDGTQMYVYLHEFKQYMTNPAPPEISQIVSSSGGNGPVGLGFRLLAESISSTPFNQLKSSLTSILYIGKENVQGVECDRISLVSSNIKWDMWIESGKKRLPRRIVPDLYAIFPEALESDPNAKLKLEIITSSWNVKPDISDSTFSFTPPEGASKVTTFGAPTLTPGQVAPTFELDLLGGGKMNLADHKGKDVVLLDFFASWCGPCRQAMPIVDKVAENFKDKGVVLYAVNERETDAQAKAFADQAGIKCKIAMDKDGSVGNKYVVDSLPRMIIIDKDGTVQAVHKGFTPALEEELTAQLNSLIKGKKLIQ